MACTLRSLSCNQERKTVRIPNEEICLEFARALKQSANAETMRRVQESNQPIATIVDGEEVYKA